MSPKYTVTVTRAWRVFYMMAALLAATQSQLWARDASQTQYSDVKNMMHELVRTHPNAVRSITVGPSDSGDTIEGVVIGNGAIHNLVVATHHGNEYGSTEVGLAFAAAVADHPIAGQSVYVIPVLNITGYNAKQREEYAGDSYHDPNRDYPGPCGTEGPHLLKSTASLAAFIDRENIVASATLHTFYPAVVYPWGIPTQDLSTPYDDLFKVMVSNATELSQYQTGNSTQVIYPAKGCYEDYAFWRHGIWSILFELGNSHNPTQADLDDMIRANVPGLRKMLEQAPQTRAANHAFTGKCDDGRLAHLDRHDE